MPSPLICNFPSSDQLDTMVNWGDMNTKSVKGKFALKRVLKTISITMRLIRFGCSLGDFLESLRNSPSFAQLAPS